MRVRSPDDAVPAQFRELLARFRDAPLAIHFHRDNVQIRRNHPQLADDAEDRLIHVRRNAQAAERVNAGDDGVNRKRGRSGVKAVMRFDKIVPRCDLNLDAERLLIVFYRRQGVIDDFLPRQQRVKLVKQRQNMRRVGVSSLPILSLNLA